MEASWSARLDLRVLRHVRGVLRRRDLELTLVDQRPAEPGAFAPLSSAEPDGPGLAVSAPQLDDRERGLIEIMLAEAARDVATALRDRMPADAGVAAVSDPSGEDARPAGRAAGVPIPRDSASLVDPSGEDPRPAGRAAGVPIPRDSASLVDPSGEDPRPAGKAVGVPTPRDSASLADPSGEDPRPAGKAVRVPTPRDSASLVDARTEYHGIIGASPAMRELYALLDRIAPSDATVLIQGENGTGKELVARAIHAGSARHDRTFVVANCSAFNDNLLDSELFGHKRGAFTGAVGDKPGLFETADTGTFFLDEIGDMSPSLQVKVLRVLQEGTFNRVGDTETRKVDVRIIAATNRDLAAMVASGGFRQDLYYRIHVLSVTLPALRDRRDDVELLIDHFLGRHRRRPKRLTADCAARMLAYPWPGNIRELENEVERLVVLSGDAVAIGADLLSPRIRQWSASDDGRIDTHSLPAAVEALERRMIGAAMRRHGGNKTRAAEELKVSRRNLIRLVQKYQLE